MPNRAYQIFCSDEAERSEAYQRYVERSESTSGRKRWCADLAILTRIRITFRCHSKSVPASGALFLCSFVECGCGHSPYFHMPQNFCRVRSKNITSIASSDAGVGTAHLTFLSISLIIPLHRFFINSSRSNT